MIITLIIIAIILIAGIIYFLRSAKGEDIEFDDDYKEWLKKEGIIK